MENEGTNGQLSRTRAYVQLAGEMWDKFGLATLLVALALATWFGWIASPFSEARDMIKRHVVHDDEIMFYMKTLCQTNASLAKESTAKCNWDPRDR